MAARSSSSILLHHSRKQIGVSRTPTHTCRFWGNEGAPKLLGLPFSGTDSKTQNGGFLGDIGLPELVPCDPHSCNYPTEDGEDTRNLYSRSKRPTTSDGLLRTRKRKQAARNQPALKPLSCYRHEMTRLGVFVCPILLGLLEPSWAFLPKTVTVMTSSRTAAPTRRYQMQITGDVLPRSDEGTERQAGGPNRLQGGM